MAGQPIAGERDVLIPARGAGASGPDRIAKVSVRFGRVSLDAPQKDPRFTAPLDVWVVYAREENPPIGVEGIEWMLLTSEAVETFEEGCERIDWYSLRWMVELNLRSIKTHLGMDILRGQTVDVVGKEIAMHLLAYNLIRLLMWHAARDHQRDLHRLSFTGILHRLRAALPF